jgi:indole-3-glycerol phosphate synthase
VSVLEEIVEYKRYEVAARRQRYPLPEVCSIAASLPRPRDFLAALSAPGLSVIAEIKRRSPAKGDLRPELDPGELAGGYARGGAAALSVLTDERYFRGSDADLRIARSAVSIPVLRKDFTIDPYQVFEARALGADAVLFIVRALPDALLQDLLSLADELGLSSLVEVHDERELERALRTTARIIGVNNRNLDTLSVDWQTSLRLRPLLPADRMTVSESGIESPQQALRLRQAGYDAILVGEALVRAVHPAALIEAMRGDLPVSGPSAASARGQTL